MNTIDNLDVFYREMGILAPIFKWSDKHAKLTDFLLYLEIGGIGIVLGLLFA